MSSTLFDWHEPPPSAPAQRHSPTSVAAAKAIEPRAGSGRAKVLAFLREQGDEGGTDEEIIAATWLAPSTARPRRVELVEAGLVRDSGRVRETASGCRAVVWVAIIKE